jgi:hypothetical protein
MGGGNLCCTNARIQRPSIFRSLSRGKLFLVETEVSTAAANGTAPTNRNGRPARQVERYWLCDCCSPSWTLTYERERGMVTVPLPGDNRSAAAARFSNRTVKRYGAEQT